MLKSNLRQHLLATGDPLSSFQLHIFILHCTKVSLRDSQFKIILMHLKLGLGAASHLIHCLKKKQNPLTQDSRKKVEHVWECQAWGRHERETKDKRSIMPWIIILNTRHNQILQMLTFSSLNII